MIYIILAQYENGFEVTGTEPVYASLSREEAEFKLLELEEEKNNILACWKECANLQNEEFLKRPQLTSKISTEDYVQKLATYNVILTAKIEAIKDKFNVKCKDIFDAGYRLNQIDYFIKEVPSGSEPVNQFI